MQRLPKLSLTEKNLVEHFLRLSRSRQVFVVAGADKAIAINQPISIQEIKAYIQLYDIDDIHDFVDYINAMDAVFLEVTNK